MKALFPFFSGICSTRTARNSTARCKCSRHFYMTPTTPIHNCYSPLPQCSTSAHPRLVIEPVTVAHWPIIFDLRLCDHLEGSTVSTWCLYGFMVDSHCLFVPTLYSSIMNNHLLQPLTLFCFPFLLCLAFPMPLHWSGLLTNIHPASFVFVLQFDSPTCSMQTWRALGMIDLLNITRNAWYEFLVANICLHHTAD